MDSAKTSCTTVAWLFSLGLYGVTVLALPVHADDTPPVPVPVPSPSPSPIPSPSPTPESPTPIPSPLPVPANSPDASGPESVQPAESANKPADPPTKEEKRKQRENQVKQQYRGGNSLGRYIGGSVGSLLDNVYISGGTSLTSRTYNVTGTQSAQSSYKETVNAQGFGTRQVGPFQQNLDLTVSGRVLDAFTLDGRFSNTSQNNYFNQVFGINYRAKGTSFNLGDVSAALPGNEFVSFARTVRGLSFGRDFGNGINIQGVGSYTQAVAKRGTFQGNGTRGPFPLQSSSILEGSEHVQLNGVDLVAGQDYLVDYQFGQITFSPGRIINPEDTVVYSYEAQNYNSTPGLLTGLRVNLEPKGSPQNIGFTWLQQKQLSGSQGVSEFTQRFAVKENLGFQYQLNSGIEAGSPVEVRYLDQLLIENKDYRLNRASRFIQMLTQFPVDTAANGISSLSVTYRPLRQASVAGDRSIMGLDGSYKVSKNANLAWQYGRSQNTVQGAAGGDAMSLDANFNGGGARNGIGSWNGTLGWRNIGDTYAGIDSTSAAFLRAEKGLRGTLAFNPTSFLSVKTSMNQSQIGNQVYTTGANGTEQNTFTWNKNTQWQGGFNLSLPKLPRLDFAHSQIEQSAQGSAGNKSRYSSDQINMNYQVGMLGVTGALGHTLSRGQSVFSSGFTNLSNTQTSTGSVVDDIRNGLLTTTASTDSASDTGRITVSLNPASWINLTGALGVSRTSYGSSGTVAAAGTSSSARDNSFGVRLPLRENLSFGFDWSDSSNGASSTSDSTLQSGYGIATQRTKTTSFDTRYQPRENLEFTLQFGRTLYLIPSYDNTDSNNVAFGVTFAPIPQFTFFGSYSSQALRYLGSQSGNSNDTTLQLQATAGPFERAGGFLKRMTYSASWQNIRTGSLLSTSYNSDIIGTTPTASSLLNSVTNAAASTSFSQQQQRLSLWSVRADYPVASRQSIYLSWQSITSFSPLSGGTAGSSTYSASNYSRGNGAIGYDFRLNDFMGITANWNLIRMTDMERSDLSYQARAFNVDLSARF